MGRLVACIFVLVFMAFPLYGASQGKISAHSRKDHRAHDADRHASEQSDPSIVRGGERSFGSGRSVVNLRRGIRIAEGRIREIAGCRELFEALGSDGSGELNQSDYHWAARGGDCRREASAYTWVGASRTCLCPNFGHLSSRGAAVTLIHEALHHAGLTEQPSDPLAMTSGQINQLVATSCRL